MNLKKDHHFPTERKPIPCRRHAKPRHSSRPVALAIHPPTAVASELPRIAPTLDYSLGPSTWPLTLTTMQRIKIFKGLESNLPALEKEVNDWLSQSGARVVHMFGNLAAQSGD